MVVNIQNQQRNDMNPGLVAPRKNYDVSVELSSGDKIKHEQQVAEYDTLIKDALAKMDDAPQTGSGEVSVENLPDEMWFVRKAEALENLGRYTQAIETLNEMFGYYEESIVGREMLGTLYRQLEEYPLAIRNYEKIIEINGDEWGVYAKKIAKMYVELGDGQTAGQRYIKYEENGGERNKALMIDIKELNK